MQTMICVSMAFAAIAFAYSMVGFGGGSSYLAILVLAGFPYQSVPPIALACNLIVAGCGMWQFYCAGHFEINRAFPFVIFSVPLAFWGGTLSLSKDLFCLLLGLALLMVALRFFISDASFEKTKRITQKRVWMIGLPVGAGLGFLSGLLGIGGGIFLSPLLLLMRWTTVKGAAACASFFIFVNSLAGLLGHLQKGSLDLSFVVPLGCAVLLGGLVGSRFGACKVPAVQLGRILAILVFCASLKMIWEVL